MKFRRCMITKATSALAAATVLAAPTYADSISLEIKTPAGLVQVVKERPSRAQLYLDNEPFEDATYSISRVIPEEVNIQDHLPNHFLLHYWGGGAACLGMFRWLDASGDSFAISEHFGTCNETVDSVRIVDGAVVIELPGPGNVGQLAFVYDGDKVREEILGLSEYDDTFNPYDPRAWIGDNVFDYLQHPKNEKLLTDIVGWEELGDIKVDARRPLHGFSEDAGWIIGSGCRQSRCDDGKVVIAISTESALPFIAQRSWNSNGWEFHGEHPNDMPLLLRQLLH